MDEKKGCLKIYERKHLNKKKGETCGKPTLGAPYCPLHSWMSYQESLRKDAKERLFNKMTDDPIQTRSFSTLSSDSSNSSLGSTQESFHSGIEISIKKLD